MIFMDILHGHVAYFLKHHADLIYKISSRDLSVVIFVPRFFIFHEIPYQAKIFNGQNFPHQLEISVFLSAKFMVC